MARLASMKEVKERKDEFSAIAAEIVDAARKGDIVGYLDADLRFHLGLLGILGNEQLVTIVGNLRDQTRQFGLKALSKAGTLVESAEEHQQILDAIIAGDRKKTAGLTAAHLKHIRGDWAGTAITP